MQKFGPSFGLALALHITILLLFGLSFASDPEQAQSQEAPEIIEATILDGAEIQAEMDKLQKAEIDHQQAEQHRQEQQEMAQKAEQQLKEQIRKQKRLDEK